MSRIKLLLDVIQDIRSLGDSLEALVQAMTTDEIGSLDNYEVIYDPEKDKLQEDMQSPQETAVPTVDRTAVRAKLSTLTRNGCSDAVKELLRNHGAERLSAIPDEELPALMKEAETIGK